jgi:hypothetical protein
MGLIEAATGSHELAGVREPLEGRLDGVLALTAGKHRPKVAGSKCATGVRQNELEHSGLDVPAIGRRGSSHRTRLPRHPRRQRAGRRCPFDELVELSTDR